jgi:hypothetical protein
MRRGRGYRSRRGLRNPFRRKPFFAEPTKFLTGGTAASLIENAYQTQCDKYILIEWDYCPAGLIWQGWLHDCQTASNFVRLEAHGYKLWLGMKDDSESTLFTNKEAISNATMRART